MTLKSMKQVAIATLLLGVLGSTVLPPDIASALPGRSRTSSTVAGRLRFRLGGIRPSQSRIGGITRGNCGAVEGSANRPVDNLMALFPPLTDAEMTPTSPAPIPGDEQVPVETTILAKPNLFVYIPPTTAETAEVLVTNGDGSETVFEGTFDVPSEPSVVQISLPADSPALEPDQVYTWSVSLRCDLATGDRAGDPLVQGLIKRVSPASDLVVALNQAELRDRPLLYADAGIWQDTLSSMANLLLQNPQDPALINDWASLLDSANLSDFAEVPVVAIEPEPLPSLFP